MIAFSCSRCQHALTRHDNETGSKIACPACGQRLTVPSATSDPAVRIRCLCPQCRAVINAEPHRAGTTANCPRCGTAFQVPPPPKADLRLATEQSIMLGPAAGTPSEPTLPGEPEQPSSRPPTTSGREIATALGWAAFILGGAAVLMVALCCGLIWSVRESNAEHHAVYLKNDIASREAKLVAMELELAAALARGDQRKAQGHYEAMAQELGFIATDCDQLALRLSAGRERDDYLRIAQDRRTRAESCRTNAALLRNAQR